MVITQGDVVPRTKQTKHSDLPGNVLFWKGDANLPRQSLARTTHIMGIDKSRLIEKIGTLPRNKTKEIINNIIMDIRGRGEFGTQCHKFILPSQLPNLHLFPKGTASSTSTFFFLLRVPSRIFAAKPKIFISLFSDS